LSLSATAVGVVDSELPDQRLEVGGVLFVHCRAVLNTLAGVQDRGVIAAAELASDRQQ